MKNVGDLLWSLFLCFAFFSCLYCLYSYLLTCVFHYIRPLFLFFCRTLSLIFLNTNNFTWYLDLVYIVCSE